MWFRKKKSKVSPAVAKPAPLDAAPSRSRFPGLRAFLIVLVLAGGAIGAVVGMNHLDRRMKSGQAGPVPTKVFSKLTIWPDWMPRSLAAAINDSLVPKDAQYNDPTLVDQVSERAAAIPWVEQVDDVKKQVCPEDPTIGEVQVRLKYRRPHARVDTGGGKFVYVDQQGTVLPSKNVPVFVLKSPPAKSTGATHFAEGERLPRGAYSIRYPTIVGVSDKTPPVGQKYDSPELNAGLRLAAMLEPYEWAKQIKSINIVANYTGAMDRNDPSLDMTAQMPGGQPTTIKFGRFPSDAGDVESSPEHKLAELDAYVKVNKGSLAGTADKVNLQLGRVSSTPYGTASVTPVR